eukprot:136179_1
MYYSWMVAFIYALVYTIAIIFTKYKATQRRKFLMEQKERKSNMKKGLIQNQQNLTPNPGRIDEENPTNPTTSNQSENTKTENKKKLLNGHRMSESVDLTQLHQQLHTSVPYGAPVSNWECFIAILHSLDGGLHLGLLVEMIRDSVGWNLQEQYLLICVCILLFYRIVSFLCVYISLPRYSYSKSIKQSQQNNDIVDILQNNQDTNDINNNNNDDKKEHIKPQIKPKPKPKPQPQPQPIKKTPNDIMKEMLQNGNVSSDAFWTHYFKDQKNVNYESLSNGIKNIMRLYIEINDNGDNKKKK